MLIHNIVFIYWDISHMNDLFLIFFRAKTQVMNETVGANWSHRYYSHGKGLGLWPNIQSEDKSVSEDNHQMKKWKLFYRKR